MKRLDQAPGGLRRVGDSDAAAALLAPLFHGLDHERAGVLHLSGSLHPLGLTWGPRGQAAAVSVPLRAVMGDALRYGSHRLVLAHNHPGGDLRPSASDRDATGQLAHVARMLGVELVDHLIFAGDDWTSFRALGLL